MAHQTTESPSLQMGSSSKRGLEDKIEARSPKRLKTRGDESADDDSVAEYAGTGDNNEPITPYHQAETPSSEQGFNTNDILPSIEKDIEPVLPTSEHEIVALSMDSVAQTVEDTATASPVHPSSESRGDSSPSLGTPSLSYTSISEGDSDEDDSEDEDWDHTMFDMWSNLPWQILEPDEDVLGMVLAWVAPCPVAQDWPEVAFGEDPDDHDSDGHDGDDDYSDDENEPEDAGYGRFASRYRRWPDFDGPGDDDTHDIIEFEEDAEWDIESDPLHERLRYPGMDASRLTGYTPDYWSETGDQEGEDTLYLGDDDDDDDDENSDDYDNLGWTLEGESSPEAQCRVQ